MERIIKFCISSKTLQHTFYFVVFFYRLHESNKFEKVAPISTPLLCIHWLGSLRSTCCWVFSGYNILWVQVLFAVCFQSVFGYFALLKNKTELKILVLLAYYLAESAFSKVAHKEHS